MLHGEGAEQLVALGVERGHGRTFFGRVEAGLKTLSAKTPGAPRREELVHGTHGKTRNKTQTNTAIRYQAEDKAALVVRFVFCLLPCCSVCSVDNPLLFHRHLPGSSHTGSKWA